MSHVSPIYWPGLKILVADKNPAHMHAIALMLEQKLHVKEVIEASDLETCNAKIAENTQKGGASVSALLGGAAGGQKETCTINFILLDLSLYEPDSFGLIKELRGKFDAKTLPIIGLADQPDSDLRSKVESAGGNGLLVKPFNAMALQNEIFEAHKSVNENKPVIKSFSLGGGKKDKPAAPASAPAASPVPSAAATPAPPKPAAPPPPPPPVPVAKKPLGGAMSIDRPAAQKQNKPAGAGTSFVTRAVAGNASDTPIAEKIDGKFQGHYHKEVHVIGGGQNCFWVNEINDGRSVRLTYLSAKGRDSGIEATIVPAEEFLYNYRLCTLDNCEIMRRNA